MKRSWLKRGTEWLVRKTQIKKKNPKRRAALFVEQYGPPTFGEFVRNSGCVVARQSGSRSGCLGPIQFCHRKSRGAGGGWKNNSFGACVVHHNEEHAMGQKTFEKTYNLDLDLECLAISHSWERAEYGW